MRGYSFDGGACAGELDRRPWQHSEGPCCRMTQARTQVSGMDTGRDSDTAAEARRRREDQKLFCFPSVPVEKG